MRHTYTDTQTETDRQTDAVTDVHKAAADITAETIY